MSVSTSAVFEFLGRHPSLLIERNEIALADFGVLRRSLRSIVLALRDCDGCEAKDLSERLQILLSEWLTVPIQFDATMLDAVQILGDPGRVEAKWGHHIRAAYDAARSAARDLTQVENPIRVGLRRAIRDLQTQGSTFKIYCHGRATCHFESLLAETADRPLGPTSFVHSVREYRQAEPFDVLIKVGPLRSRGWGSTPDAVVAAHRFPTLLQFVWAGCCDEPGFGTDPVTARARAATDSRDHHEANQVGALPWTTHVTRIGDDGILPGLPVDEDDFQLLRSPHDAEDRSRATLFQIDEDHGVLYPLHSQVLSFDPDVNVTEPIGHRVPADTLVEGMFIIRPVLADSDLGGLHAGAGRYSETWKKRLRESVARDANGLVERLRAEGIGLVGLRSCIEHWCRPPSTVIHAPQQRWHFEILIAVLGVDFEPPLLSGRQQRPWWQYAWREIQHARGDAIQLGMQEHDIIDEELLRALGEQLPEIRSNSLSGENFTIQLPQGGSLQGDVLFFRVRSVEEGFVVPFTALTVICELNAVEQWRA